MRKQENGTLFRFNAVARVFAIGSLLCVSACGTPDIQSPPSAVMQKGNARQEIFATPEQAVDALISATRNDQQAELLKIMGPRARKLISSGDPVADQRGRAHFLAAYDEAHEIKSESNGRDMLVVGDDEWPMPIPLVQAKGGWEFDAAAGKEEILNRRIGRNELNVIGICRVYVEAQQDFAATQHEYAQHFRSAGGQHNGLYWPAAEGQPESPLGPLIANATAEGYSGKVLSRHTPYHGYYYRILKKQGIHASGGAKNYITKGHMTRGFALIAFPASYGNSGVMTFIISQNGIVYEKNLGANTAKIARRIAKFDPDNSWNIVR